MVFTSLNNGVKKTTPVSGPVKKLYSVIKKRSGAVGGYGHHGPVYGEITMGSFQKVVDFLKEHCQLDETSQFLDIGAGLGKPNLHVALDPGVSMSFGIELENLRHQLSLYNLSHCLLEVEQLKKNPNVYFLHHDATDMVSLNPFSHVYMFDVGFPPDALVSLANSFNKSTTTQVLVSFQKPKKIIEVYGFAVRCIGNIKTTMCGSSEGHTAYIYSATPSIPKPGFQILTPTALLTNQETENVGEEEKGAQKQDNEKDQKAKIDADPMTPIRAKKRKQQQQKITNVFAQAKRNGTVANTNKKSKNIEFRQKWPSPTS